MSLLQQLINGLVLGHAYALIAIGWTLLLGVARLVDGITTRESLA